MELLFEFDDRRHERPSYEVPWMFDEGRVVLDLDNEPVNDYRDIPLTLSSVVEGALMEAIRRLDPRIRHFDFWARLSVHPCPAVFRQRLTHDRPEHCKGGPVLTPTALSNRMYRFRLKNAVATWSKGDDGDRKGSGTLRQFLWDRMVRLPQSMFSLFKQIGSIETLSRCFCAPPERTMLT